MPHYPTHDLPAYGQREFNPFRDAQPMSPGVGIGNRPVLDMTAPALGEPAGRMHGLLSQQLHSNQIPELAEPPEPRQLDWDVLTKAGMSLGGFQVPSANLGFSQQAVQNNPSPYEWDQWQRMARGGRI